MLFGSARAQGTGGQGQVPALDRGSGVHLVRHLPEEARTPGMPLRREWQVFLLHVEWTSVEGVPWKGNTPMFVLWHGGALGGELSMGGASRMLIEGQGPSASR